MPVEYPETSSCVKTSATGKPSLSQQAVHSASWRSTEVEASVSTERRT
jgi:hypothetical protein